MNPQQPPTPPFTLTPEEEAQVDRVLQAWEKRSQGVKTFECEFTRFSYNGVFGKPDEPLKDPGELKYAAPDKGMFRITGQQPEQWVCDGKSIFQFDYTNKKLIEHKLPPEMQGAAIADGPIPFLFGTKAETLKQRYFLKIDTSESHPNTDIWILAFPRRLQEKQSFDHAEVILSLQSMLPKAIKLHDPNGKDSTVYVFEAPKINPINVMPRIDPLRLFGNNDPFAPETPKGWQRITEEPPQRQANAGGPPPRPRR